MRRGPLRGRDFLLWGALALTVIATLLVSKEDKAGKAGHVVAVVERGQSDSAGRRVNSAQDKEALLVSAAHESLTQIRDRRIDEDLPPLFEAVKKRVPEAQTATAVAAPPEPVAPPLPFRYLGQMTDEGRVTLFLSVNDRNIAVRVGETIDDQYRVDSIANGVAVFTYLPLKHRQTMPVGERS